MKPLVVVTRDVNKVLNIQVERGHANTTTPVLRVSLDEAATLEKILGMFRYNEGLQSVTEQVPVPD